MNRWILPAILFIASLAAGTWLTLDRLPGLIMDRALQRLTGLEAGAVRHAPRLTAQNQTIVRASPDILYSLCLYDLSAGPMRIEAPWPADGNYASVSFYDANSSNFAVISDRDADTNLTTINLAGAFESYVPGEADRLISAPTKTGLILYRRVIDAETDFLAAESERRNFTCTLLNDR